MNFDDIRPFEEAIQSNLVKALLPTDLTSAELSELEAELLRLSFFSARVYNAEILDRAKALIDAMLAPVTVSREEQEGLPAVEGLDLAEARNTLREFIQSTDYLPAKGKEGGIEDLTSDSRLNLLLKTQTEMSLGYGHWRQGQNPHALDVWPAAELYRAEDRKEPRDWPLRWAQAAEESGDDDALRVFQESGRMIALKDSEIWQAIGDGAGGYDDTLHNPWPPFAFQSGMDVKDIDRDEAVSLGLMEPEDSVEPQEDTFLDNFEASPSIGDPDIESALLDSLGDDFKIEGGVLTYSD